MSTSKGKTRKQAGAFKLNLQNTEDEKNHHLTGPFLPQTPLGSSTPARSNSPALANGFASQQAKRSALVRWAVDPSLAFKLLLLPIVLYLNWELLAPYVHPSIPNPFGSIFFISGRVPASSPEDPRYEKTWWDLAFVAYYVVFFSFVRESLAKKVSTPVAKYFGLRREAKLERFAEQNYAFLYFMVFGAWGFRVMTQLPIYWYNSPEYWKGYPFWDIKPELKRYYLMQFSYWWQQLIVLVLGLEKPRIDYAELVLHHFVTLWLIGWSYLVNHTYLGNAVFMSMDIPDSFLAFSKILNYIQWNTAKVYSFGIFFVVWTYFRHYLNLCILWSVWFDFDSLPDWTKHWSWAEGVYMAPWMQYQIFVPLLILQGLNLFWYRLMAKILYRGIMTSEVDDQRSDDEGDDGDDDEKEN